MHTEDQQRLNDYLQQCLNSAGDPISANLRQFLHGGGKQLRPTLIVLAARLLGDTADAERLLPLQAAMELLHSATLIHDDIIDNSRLRRGRPSLHVTAGVPAAILHGDYLLALALSLVEQYQQPQLLQPLAGCLREMCLAEFLQLDGAFSLEKQTLRHYFRRIRRKTASLFAACCQMGAIMGGADAEQYAALSAYGENLGMAFQITDDILDFAPSPQFGKPQGQDLQQGVFTLPLLYAIKSGDAAGRIAAVAVKEQKSAADTAFLLQAVNDSGGIAAARKIAAAYSKKAAKNLAAFSDCEAKNTLLSLAEELRARQM